MMKTLLFPSYFDKKEHIKMYMIYIWNLKNITNRDCNKKEADSIEYELVLRGDRGRRGKTGVRD